MSTSLRRLIRPLVMLVAVAGILALASTVWRRVRDFGRPPEPTITHALVVQQVRDVAKLIASEMTVRDVVVYDQSRFGLTKRALLVVTGTVQAGIDLREAPPVEIDHEAKRIRIALPPARILGVDVAEVRTYDERAGLFNPFRPGDRDAIYRQVRLQLVRAGEGSGLVTRADRSARDILVRLLARDGYTVDVRTARTLEVETR